MRYRKCCRRGVDHLDDLELDVLAAKMLEHPGAAAKEHGHEMDLDLVHEPGRDVLLSDARAAQNADVLITSDGLRLLEGALDAVGYERVHPSIGHLRRRLVRDHEHRPPGGTSRPIRPHHATEES